MIAINKMSVDEIRARYDNEADRFSDLGAGQATIVDSPLLLELVARAAAACSPGATTVLDIGCGAGNATLNLLRFLSPRRCDLLDLSMPMLRRARQRVSAVTDAEIRLHQKDIREAGLPRQSYDVVLAATVLHHLRDDRDWESTFEAIHGLLAPGGSLWITDLVAHDLDPVHEIMWQRYGDYLVTTSGEEARDRCFAEIEAEDTPRPLSYQLDLLRRVGFRMVEVLHKNTCFAAFGALK